MYLKRLNNEIKYFSEEETEKEDGFFARRRKAKKLNEDAKENYVKWVDRLGLRSIAKYKKKKLDNYKKYLSEDVKEREEEIDRFTKKNGIIGGVVGGTALSTLLGVHGAAFHGAKGGVAGAAIGAGLGAASGAYGIHKNRKNYKENSNKAEKYKNGKTAKRFERHRDLVKVAENKMSTADFADKWNSYDKRYK